GVRAAPVRVEREGERVQVRGDVALAAGIAVEPPGAADVLPALEDREVVQARLLEADGHAQAGEARADDRDVDLAPRGAAAVGGDGRGVAGDRGHPIGEPAKKRNQT